MGLITEDDTSKELYQDFVTVVSKNDKLRNALIDIYFDTKKEIDQLEAELKTKSNKSVLEQNIEANARKVGELNESAGLTTQQVVEYKALQSKLDSNSTKRQNFRDDFSAIKGLNGELVQALKTLKQKKDFTLNQIQIQEIKYYYQTAYSEIENLLERVNDIEASIEIQINVNGKRSFKHECKFKEIVTLINNEQKSINDSILPYLKDDQVKKTIEGLNESIANDKKALIDIENLAKKIQDKNTLLEDTKVRVFQIYESSYEEYLRIINSLKERTIELEKDGLSIVGKAQFNFVKLRKDLFAISDGRSASYNQYNILSEDKKATDKADFEIIITKIKELFHDLISKKYVLTNRTSIQAAVKLVLYDHFFDYWEITYKNDRLGEMSTGKASFVILMLIIGLSKSKAPILIDQPEDNLDNRSITTDLVNYLRNKKIERQIIIVTHNANIVVNADAENVIVANQKGQNDEQSTSVFKFDYINGAIENSFDKLPEETDILKSMGIRQHVAEIVEGGKEAFIMREKKYRFQ